MRGAIWTGDRLVVADDLVVRPPGPGEVRVRVLSSGICHSDLNRMVPAPARTPVVLGHEAAGIVAELGTGVGGLALGQPVMVCSQTPCGRCRECRRGAPANCAETWGFQPAQPFTWRGRPVFSYANISSFAEEIVVRHDQVFPTGGLPSGEAALIGCAVATGWGAIHHLARVQSGDRVAVIGVGGIGVNAIRAARLHGAERILAIDINARKADAARQSGADRFIAADGADLPSLLAAEAPIDAVIECSGALAAITLSFDLVKRGGRVVLVGLARPGARLDLDLGRVLLGSSLLSTYQGGTAPADFPGLIDLVRCKEIDVASQISQVWPLAEIEAAIAALRAGEVTRAVLDLA